MFRKINLKSFYVRVSLFLAILFLQSGNANSTSITINIDPKKTYLTTYNDPGAGYSAAINLNSYEFYGGDTILLEQLGDFKRGEYYPDDCTSMIGVFSFWPYLWPGFTYDAGADFTTPNTYFGGYSTDIAEDFLISSTLITIPADAVYLLVAASDSYYEDNSDPDNDFAVQISSSAPVFSAPVSSAPVPEPATMLLLGSGLVGLAGLRRKFKR